MAFCPKCKTKVEKESGCNHMTCYICKFQWCWLCGGTYSQYHYMQGKCQGMQFQQRGLGHRMRLNCPSSWTLLVYSARISFAIVALAALLTALLPGAILLVLTCLRINPVIAFIIAIAGSIPLYILVPNLFIICVWISAGLEVVGLIILSIALIIDYRHRRAF